VERFVRCSIFPSVAFESVAFEIVMDCPEPTVSAGERLPSLRSPDQNLQSAEATLLPDCDDHDRAHPATVHYEPTSSDL
jgi:hypothetical protein